MVQLILFCKQTNNECIGIVVECPTEDREERSMIQDSTEALYCVIEQDTISSLTGLT